MSIQEKRQELKAKSAPLKQLVQEGAIESVNEGLLEMYRELGHTDLKPFWEWKKQGYTIKKGEKALCIWGTPRTKKSKEPPPPDEKEKEEQFYPVAYVFSRQQVTKKGD